VHARVLVMGTHINLLGACKMQPSMMMTRAIAHTGSEIVQFSRHFGVMAQFGRPPAATTTTVNFVKQQKSSDFLAPHRFSIPEPLVMVMIPGQSQNARAGFGILEMEKNLARSCARVCCCASISGSSSTTQEGRDAAPSSSSTLELGGGRKTSIVPDLLQFLNKSWTPFHATAEAKRQLLEAGFEQLCEEEEWAVQPGGRYFFTRNMSSIFAFAIGQKLVLCAS
jgi:hypothetical protein